MEHQNVTLSIRKDVLKKAKHLALNQNISLSKLLTQTLEKIVEEEEKYVLAQNRQLLLMEQGFELKAADSHPWKREDLYDRR
ncbi:DUF6364 family protein [Dethiobacter alkaliphilus]|uniref:DUF6364 family protein n=1 Tax=Dethiobacter alkaliphilus TaxID=427926 RepID=UPI002227C2BB|nr:DUF6364 family protein [Dethiobacter alkaliphilus]MCW3488602.1 DUF6364 family protein [Dethiobacter alkaliphilus]